MIASQLINPMLPSLKPSDSVRNAMDWMEEQRCYQLAVVEAGEYRGLVSYDFLEEITSSEDLIGDLVLQLPEVYATEFQHIFELLRLSVQHGLESIPVLYEDLTFAGSIEVSEMLKRFADALGVQEPGAVLVLKVEQRDYSMAEVSRLIESDGVKIISSYYTTRPVNGGEESFLTFKLNKREVTAVVSTLERYGYHIQELYANDPVESIDRQRLDLLLKYLET